MRTASSTLAVPIMVEGKPAGVIWLETSRPEGFDASVEDILTALAAQTATAIVNARRFEDEARRSAVMQQRAEQLSHLLDISRMEAGVGELETPLAVVDETVGQSEDVQPFGVQLLR